MSTSVLDMSVSVDGYIAGPNDEPGNPGGDGFAQLHEWGFTPDGTTIQTEGASGQLMRQILECGAVVAGRRTAEQVQHWNGEHPGGGVDSTHPVPVFVPSHRPPDASVAQYPLITYVNDGIESAMAQAKAAAGDRNVHVIGGYTARRALEAGVLDEIQLHHVPVLLGGGRRLFDVLPTRIQLEIISVTDTPEATHVRYRVRR